MKNILKVSKLTITLILALTMSFTLPLQAFAQSLPEDNCQTVSFDNLSSFTEETGNILYEIKDNRNEFSKTFMLDNGTRMLAEYNQPVHYKDSDNNWNEYDNTLTTATSDEAEPELTNKSSDIKIKASNKAKDKNMIKLQNNDYKISWGYANANKSEANIINKNENNTGNEKFTTLDNAVSEIMYYDVYTDVDLQYSITSTGIKENIILKSAEAPNEFNINYRINNLSAKQINNTTIELYNKDGETVYTIESPYMMDANGNTSTQLDLEIISQKDSNLSIKLTADYWFIHSIGRAFPITIDPEITKKLSSAISLNEGTASISLGYGPYYTSSSHYVIAQINSLPELNDGERIISAKFNFETTNGTSLFTSENDAPIIINAHKLNSINGNIVSYDSTILDYDSITYNDNKNMSFDLTKTLNDWYDNGNKIDGFILEAFDTAGTKQVNFQTATSSSVTPSLTMVYKDFTGTEGNHSYHTIPVGQNAQANINDYLGNLVISQPLYEGTGSRMPVTITATYNSLNYDKIFANGSPSGYGWQFSFNQYIREANTELTNAGYNYIYTDSDGTDHYLKKSDKNEEWLDEDGLGITLTKSETNMYIDNGAITQTYELPSIGGKLLSEKDEHNNTITYSYTDDNVSTITDGSGRTITITYYTTAYGEKRVNYITLPDQNEIQFTYTSEAKDKISSIELPEKRASKFTYNDNGRITSVAQTDSISGSLITNGKVTFDYNNKAQVTKITEYGSDNTEGNYLNINYGNDNTNVFTDRQNRNTTYTFDNGGNLISVLNANGYIQSNNSNGLSISSGTESFTKNYITESTEHTEIGNYYTKFDGQKENALSRGGIATIDNSDPTTEDGYVQYFGTTSIKLNNPVTENNSAFFTGVTHQFDNTSFAGKDVTFSAYVKTKDISEIYYDGTVGASLSIQCYNSDGTILDEYSSIGITDTHDWQRLSVSINIPSNTSYFKIFCNIRYATGTAWFDCLQLEEGNSANDFNALQNADFKTNEHWLTSDNTNISAENGIVTLNGIAGAYDNMSIESEVATESTTTTDDVELPTIASYGNYAVPDSYLFTYDEYGNVLSEVRGTVDKTIRKVYIDQSQIDSSSESSTESSTETLTDTITIPETSTNNNSLGNNYIYQVVNVDRSSVVFNLSGEAQANSVPLTNEHRTFGIALNIYYKDTTIPETYYQEFNASTTHKQSVCMSISPKNYDKEINYVAFAFVYGYNKNTMTIDNAMLNISTIPLQQTDTTTDTENNINSDDSLTYDGYIYCESTSESLNKNYEYIQNNQTYDSTGNYVASKTNKAGYVVNYTYDVNGNVISTTDAKDNTTNSTYDASGNLTSISNGNTSNQYFYNGAGVLSSISHNNFNYVFNYDVYNNLISTQIGDVELSSNSYNSNNGNLQKTTYANGDYIEYFYDDYDNIVETKGKNGTLAIFTYNKKGLISKVFDKQNESTIFFYYDLSGNIERKYCQNKDGDLTYYVSKNLNGDIIEKTLINGQEKTIVRSTDEGETSVNNDGIVVSKTEDDFERITQVKTSRESNNNSFYKIYEYANGIAENSTTHLVSKLTQKFNNFVIANFQYIYDKNGNITHVYQNGVLYTEYVYDNLNQLTRVIDRNTETYTYLYYDSAGNITKIKKHGLSINGWVPTNQFYEKEYTYNDSVWKDKLTSYNSTQITYDAVGNPINYLNGKTLTWENGRNLKTITTNDNIVNMKYNFDGLRIQKDDNEYTTNYYYDSNNNLIGMNISGTVLYFYYDSDGTINAMSFDGTMYYYIKNLQGDIIAIVNELGTTVATYKYDALGKVVTQTDSTIYNIANLNPFRYRGYVYDKETGFYYLQSRYYDPETGRFLNADIYCDTLSSILGTNMYAYCNNNPINQIDPKGTDAIWLQDRDGVYTMGHTSLLIQDNLNIWWFTYWGETHIAAYIYGHGTIEEFWSYINQGFDPRPNHNYYVNTHCGNTFESMIYFKGNFHYSLKYYINNIFSIKHNSLPISRSSTIQALVSESNKYYNLTSLNCVQSCIDALSLGKFYSSNFISKNELCKLRKLIIPNIIFNKLTFDYTIDYTKYIITHWFL